MINWTESDKKNRVGSQNCGSQNNETAGYDI